MKKVAFVAGTAFCGSSLLNILLDTQTPGIRGLGERSQTDGESGGPCIHCNKFIPQCELYRRWNGEKFYEFNFDHYGCSTVVDSSKRTNILLRAMAEEPQYKYHVLHMSKTPHAAAHSILKHWQHDYWDVPLTESKRDIFAALEAWWSTNALYLNETRQAKVQAVKHVHYDDVAKNPAAVVEVICGWLDEPFLPERLSNWRSPTTHILGGNPSIFMQVLGHGTLPDGYLGGKYAQRRGQIFVDEGWKRDADFLKSCLSAYQKCRPQLDPVLAALGYGDTKTMEQELSECLRSLGSGPRSRRLTTLTRIGGFFGLRKAA